MMRVTAISLAQETLCLGCNGIETNSQNSNWKGIDNLHAGQCLKLRPQQNCLSYRIISTIQQDKLHYGKPLAKPQSAIDGVDGVIENGTATDCVDLTTRQVRHLSR